MHVRGNLCSRRDGFELPYEKLGELLHLPSVPPDIFLVLVITSLDELLIELEKCIPYSKRGFHVIRAGHVHLFENLGVDLDEFVAHAARPAFGSNSCLPSRFALDSCVGRHDNSMSVKHPLSNR